MTIEKILFPTDFSETAVRTAAYAADLAKRHGAKVYLLHVIYDISGDSGWYGSHLNMDSIYDDVKKSAEAELDRIARAFPDGIEVERVLRIGRPHEDIVAYAKEAGIDMIVIGSHGRKVIGRVLFGSTAQRVVRRASCPVLTVRDRA